MTRVWNRWLALSLFAILFVALTVGFPPPIFADEGEKGPQGLEALVVQEVPQSEQLAAEQFWTREKLLSTPPLPLPVMTDKPSEADDWGTTADGPAEMVPGGPPNPELTARARELFPEDWTQLESLDAPDDFPQAEPMSHSSAPPFTRYYVNRYSRLWDAHPWRTIGKLFFTIPGLGRASCSAAVAYRRVVWTAGHCVYTPGRGWHTNMVFYPAYRNGAAPYGRFTVFARVVLQEWASDANPAYDIAMVAVRDRNGAPIGSWVGWLGAMWGYSATQHFHAFGYPGNFASGRYLTLCVASTARRDSKPGPDPIGIGCDMKQGSSGGPWLVQYVPYVGGDYVNGVTSYGYDGRDVTYSPYFGNGARNLYNWGKTQ